MNKPLQSSTTGNRVLPPKRFGLKALLGIAVLMLGSGAQAATYYVDPGGSDGASGSQSAPWKTISWALSSSSPVAAGDTVLINPGTYTEDVIVAKSGSSGNPITVKGNGNVQGLIASGSGTPNAVVNEPNTGNGWQTGLMQMNQQHDLVFDGLYLKNAGWGGFCIMAGTNITVQNCWTYNSGASGIIALFAQGASEQTGEWEVQNHNIKALHNRIQQANQKRDQESISFWGVDGYEIANNIVYHGGCEGIDAKVGSRNGSIHNNEVTDVGVITAVAPYNYGAPAIYLDANKANASNNLVYANYVHDTWGNGYSVNSEVAQYTESNVRVWNNVCVKAGKSGNSINGFTVGPSASNVWFYNNTSLGNGIDFYANSTNSGCGFVNNIAASAGFRPMQVDATTNLTIAYNVIRSDGSNGTIGYGSGQDKNTTAINNIFVPLSSIGLADTTGSSRTAWNLVSGSPAIDAGTATINSSISAPSNDFYGNPRPVGNGYDIGAQEYGSSSSGATLISQGKTAVASSTESSTYSASNAFDGNLGTRWSSQVSDPQWIYVDLGTTSSISKIVLTWETACASNYVLQVAPDGTSSSSLASDSPWTTLQSVTGNTTSGTSNPLTYNVSGSGRYVRMKGTARATQWGYSLWEMQVYGTASGQTPTSSLISQSQPAVASSTESSTYSASSAFDGNLGTRWSSLYSDPQWIYVDLGSTKTITQIKLFWETACASNYVLQVAPDGTSSSNLATDSPWTTLQSVTGNTTSGTGNPLTYSVSGSGRYVRMKGTSRATQWGYSLWEMQVYGY